MIRSMTGFGEAHRDEDGHAYSVEIRSVNNRYFKASIRLPEDIAFLEPDVEQQLRRRLTRGSITLRLRMRNLTADAAPDVNVAVLERYTRLLAPLADKAGPDVTLDLATLASLPGVIQPREWTEAQRDATTAVVAALVDHAVDALLAMRSTEGAHLAADLQTQCAVVTDRVEQIAQRAPSVIQEYHERLHSRIKQLVADKGLTLAHDDLIREVAVYADRCDISEELARLRAHLDQFTGAIKGDDAAGRRLDFIAQEMLREINTIGSKANDPEIARLVIDVKSAIDRIKEQVQNVE